MLELSKSGDLRRFDALIHNVGGCENPVWLRGETLKRAVDTGLVVERFNSDGSPVGAIAVRCMNRRASRCAPCARLYKGDTYQLILAGLVGGIKGVPAAVRSHPKVFATLTAPSFGPVHRAAKPGDASDWCRVRRGSPVCKHGNPLSCDARHAPDDPVVGSPLCSLCFDYTGAVLFNAHASELFGALVDTVYHHLARFSGQPRSRIRSLVRVEYVRNAEFQARGVVHFHTALRLDGPNDRADPPPGWATADVLAECVVSAARAVSVTVPGSSALGELVLRFGAQIDAHAVNEGGDEGLASEKVAGYLAKYVSKSTEDAHGVDERVTHASQINLRTNNAHVRSLMWAAWRLGALPEFKGLNLWRWCHMLGFRGHNTTASRLFSVTRGGLAREREAYKEAQNRKRQSKSRKGKGAEQGPAVPTATEKNWRYVRRGYHNDGMAAYAGMVRESIEENRQAARDALGPARPRGGDAS